MAYICLQRHSQELSLLAVSLPVFRCRLQSREGGSMDIVTETVREASLATRQPKRVNGPKSALRLCNA